jgi:tetratricopeptide (TPR) repeat protein
LALVSALLDAGRLEEAERTLTEYADPRSSAWRLRSGLLAMLRRRLDQARSEAAAVREPELPAEDAPWFIFLQAEILVGQGSDFPRARELYAKAEAAARSEIARARFALAGEVLRLRMGAPREADLKAAKDNYERYQATPVGYGFAQNYAVALDAIGQKGQAVSFLQGVLVGLPRQDQVWWDKLRLVLGIIGDRSRNGAGRNALGQLLETGGDAAMQRQALQILSVESSAEPEREHFRALLGRLIGRQPDHPVKETLLFMRAQLALADKEFAQAEEDANALLRQFALSPLRAHALAVLAQSAWEQRRFRLAADFSQRTRAELRALSASGADAAANRRLQSQLGILEAEAWFRAGLAAGDRGDFRSAADAYAGVLRLGSTDLPVSRVSGLMLQRVLSEIRAGSTEAGKVLDEYAADPAFDAASRWQAEWSLARALQVRGSDGMREAYERVNRLLGGETTSAAVKPELRVRMSWLQARLSFDTGDLERTLSLVDRLIAAPTSADPALKAEVAATSVLLRARAEFALGREPAALETLRRLRADFPRSDAAASSYLIEAEQYVAREQIDKARNALIALTDQPDYRGSGYLPFALFRLASLAERLGRPENLQEANKRLEELVAHPSANGQADLIFAARLRQGDIFRKLNDFDAAGRAYEDLINRYPRRPDVVLAQLALAATYAARASAADGAATGRSHADSAQLIYEQLRDRVDAPRDVRVEAGYNLGVLLVRRGRPEDAITVWTRDVVVPFLREETKPFEPDAKRPYFLARTLRDLGDLLETQGRLDEAREAYRLLLEKRLPIGESVARTRLQQLGGPGSAK